MLPMRLPRLAMVAVRGDGVCCAATASVRCGDGVLARRRCLCCVQQRTVASEAADSSQVVLQTARWPNSRPLRVLSSQTPAQPKPGLAACKVLACIKTHIQPFECRSVRYWSKETNRALTGGQKK